MRSKAGARIKQLVAKDKALEEEVAALREQAEMNASKLGSMQSALEVMQDETKVGARVRARLPPPNHHRHSPMGTITCWDRHSPPPPPPRASLAQTVKDIEAKHAQDHAYLRALILRYLEMESQHEALFPAIAMYFKFTEAEVDRLAKKQEEHAFETSVLGRTLSVGSALFGVAREAAQEVQTSYRR